MSFVLLGLVLADMTVIFLCYHDVCRFGGGELEVLGIS